MMSPQFEICEALLMLTPLYGRFGGEIVKLIGVFKELTETKSEL